METDIDTSQLTTDEQVAILIDDLPHPIQRFLKSPERDTVSLQLTKKYGLHADDAGAFERAYIYMLLGIFTPDEFVQELRESGLDDATIRGLAADVNEQVFKKLRTEERGEVPAPAAYRSEAPAPQVPPIHVGERAAIPANLPGQGIHPQWTQPSSIAPTPLPASPTTPVPDAHVATEASPALQNPPQIPAQPSVGPATPPTPSVSVPIYSQPPPTAPEYPRARTMAGDMELASQGPKADAPTPPPPPPPIPTQPEPPHAQPAPPPPAWQPPPTAPVRPTPIDRPSASDTPITKEYGNDPYREPIE